MAECGVCVLRLYKTIWCLEDRVLPTPDLHTYQLYNPVFLGIWGITDPHGLQHHDIRCAQIAHWVQTLGVVIRLYTVKLQNGKLQNAYQHRVSGTIWCMWLTLLALPTNIMCMEARALPTLDLHTY